MHAVSQISTQYSPARIIHGSACSGTLNFCGDNSNAKLNLSLSYLELLLFFDKKTRMSVTVSAAPIIPPNSTCAQLANGISAPYTTRRPKGRAILRSSAPDGRKLPRIMRMRCIQQYPLSSPDSRLHDTRRRHFTRPSRATVKVHQTDAPVRNSKGRHIHLPPLSPQPRNPSSFCPTQCTWYLIHGFAPR